MKPICSYEEFNTADAKSSVLDNISETAPEFKETVIEYLKSFKPSSIAPTIAYDLISGEKLNITLYCSHDDLYYWRSDVIYYFEKYNLKLSDDFINYVLNKSI